MFFSCFSSLRDSTELTLLANNLSCVRNLCVKAYTDDQSITMLYSVEPGVSDCSFGVHVAQVATFPPEVVRLAREKAMELEQQHRWEMASRV